MDMSVLVRQLRDMMKCKVCLEEKEHQKQLPCQHTLCLECLDQLEIDNAKYRCPFCNQAFLVPNGGFETLPESLSTKQLANVIGFNISGQQTHSEVDDKDSPRETESVRQLQKAIEKATEVLKLAETRIDRSVEMEKEMATQVDTMKAMLQSLYDKAIADLMTAAEAKSEAIEERAKVWNENMSMKNTKMKEAYRNACENMQQLKDKATALQQSGESADVSNELQQSHAVLEILKDQMQVGTNSGNGKFHDGDSVRLKLDIALVNENLLKRKIDHNSVGYILEVDSDGDCCVAFPDCGNWAGKTDMLEKSPVPHNLPVVGDRVKIRKTVTEPKFGWAGVTHESIGVLKRVLGVKSNGEKIVEVQFAGKSDWKGLFVELEKAQAEQLKVGDEVWIVRTLDAPVKGWAGVTHSSVGVLLAVNGDQVTVQFPECEKWQGLITELERTRPVQAGDRVRVKKSVKKPKKGWGGLNHESEGIVMGVHQDSELGEAAIVNFPMRLGLWKGGLDELEIVGRSIGGKKSITIGLPDMTGGGLEALREQHRQHMEQMEQCNTQ